MSRHIPWLVTLAGVLAAALVLVGWHLAVVLPPHEDDGPAARLAEARNARVVRVARPTPGAVLGGGLDEEPGYIVLVSFLDGPVPREQLATVSGLRQCDHVGFSNVTFPDPGGLELLAAMPRLVSLKFAHDSVTDEVLARHLIGLPRVQDLQLQDNPLTDGCVDAVARLPALLRVYVHGTRITPAGVDRLRRLRPGVEVDTTTPAYP